MSSLSEVGKGKAYETPKEKGRMVNCLENKRDCMIDSLIQDKVEVKAAVAGWLCELAVLVVTGIPTCCHHQ